MMSPRVTRFADRLSAAAVRTRPIAAGVRWLARDRTLVLLYHRVSADGPQPHQIVPAIDLERFRQHLRAMKTIADPVELAVLTTAGPGAVRARPARAARGLHRERATATKRPSFAVSFDDDDAGHVDEALGVLIEEGIAATFFLSGRWLHGRGPYWWELLETFIVDHGLRSAADALAELVEDAGRTSLLQTLQEVRSAPALGGVVVTAGLEQLVENASAPFRRSVPRTAMTDADVQALINAGMTIGFHTVDHRQLPRIDDDALVEQLTFGRRELEAVAGQPIDLLAYPYGRAGDREARAARAAGFTCAWTTAQRPVATTTDPHLLGRWEPGDIDGSEVIVGALQRLARRPVGAVRYG